MIDFVIKAVVAVHPVELFLIFLLKAIEVSIATLRIILISKGYRRYGTILSFFEVLLWTFVASRVIMSMMDAPIKGIMYSLGFSLGVYVGSRIESYIAMGRVLIQAIVSKEQSDQITGSLRDKGYAVTTMEAQGRDSQKSVLMIFAKRRGKEEIISEIHRIDETAMIITNDVTYLQGGTIAAARRLFK